MDYQSPILNKKLEIYLDRSRKTISSWLNAYIIAEARVYPRRKELIDVYDYIMLDNHLKGVVRNRKNKIVGEKWQLVDELGVTMDDETKLLQKAWFKKFIRLALEAKPYGYSLVELGDLVDGEIKDVKLIDRRNVSPERREILIRPSDIYGISIDEPSHVDNYVLVDGEEGLGLLLSAAPDVIYKRYAKAAWTEHAENFSLPFLHAKTDLADEDGVAKLRDELSTAGRERLMLTGHGDELTTVAQGSADAHKIYDELIERCNGELSKLIVGQTMTTDDGSSRSQGEVHERVSDQIAKDDRDFIEDVVNDHLIPKLINLGYPLEGCKFTYNLSKEATVDEKVKVFTMLLTHYDVDPLTIKETFGVDVEKKEPVDVAAKGKGLYPGAEEEKGGKVVALPFYSVGCHHSTHSHVVNFDYPAQVVQAFLDKLAALIWEGKRIKPKVAKEFFELYKEAFRKAIEDGWQSAGVAIDYTSPDMLRLAVMEANVFRFAAAKSATLVKQLSVYARKFDNFSDFRKAAEALNLQYNKRYLETEYNFAQAVGQNGAKYQRQIQEKETFPYLVYQTVGDSRVRDAHRVLDGKIFEVGSDAHDIIQAPNGWGCRCELNQITAIGIENKKPLTPAQVERLLRSVKNGKDSTEWEYMVKHGFNINRGKLGEVFRESEMYTDLKK